MLLPCFVSRRFFILCIFFLSIIGCNSSNDNDGDTIQPQHVTITGVADDGTSTSPLREAVCLVIDLNGAERARTTANAEGMYSVQVETGVQGFLSCHLPELSNLTLTTFVSTQNQPGGARLEQEDVNPSATVAALLVRARLSDNPLRVKTELLDELRAGGQPFALLAEVATVLFNHLKDNNLNVDFTLALTDLFADGDLDQAALRDVIQDVDASIAAMTTPSAIARGFVRLASVGRACGENCESPDESDEGDEGAETSDGGVEGDADDGTETSPLAFAVCRYVTMANAANGAVDDAVIAVTVADAQGHFFFPLDPAPAGFVECHPPALPGLVATTFVRQGERGERITGQDVEPNTTLVSGIVQEFRAAFPDADLAALKNERLGAIGSETNISLLADSSVELFNAMLDEALNADYRRSLADLFADGALDEATLQPIAAQVEQFVAEQAQARGVTVEVASTVGNIRGAVIDQFGDPAADVEVIATQNGQEVGRATTEVDGAFSILNLPRGETTVTARIPGLHIVETTVVAVASVEAELIPVLISPLDVVVDRTGDLIIFSPTFQALVRLSQATEKLTVISGGTTNTGSGPRLGGNVRLAIEDDGSLVVISGTALLRVDPATGDRTLVSGCTDLNVFADFCLGDSRGGGPSWSSSKDLVVESDGSIVVIDASNLLIRVDPSTGNRTLLSGCTDIDSDSNSCAGESRGRFPLLGSEIRSRNVESDIDRLLEALRRLIISGDMRDHIEIESDGNFVLADRDRIIRVNSTTGDRSVVSGCNAAEFLCEDDDDVIGSGPRLTLIDAIAVDSDGSLIVADDFGDSTAILRVDPSTGNRTLLSSELRGSGPPLFGLVVSMILEGDGSLVILLNDSVIRVDLATGNRTRVIAPSFGNGPDDLSLSSIAVETDGGLVVGAFGAILRVDPVTGDRTLISGCAEFNSQVNCSGSGLPLGTINDIVIGTDGSLVVGAFGAILRVDPVTGDRSLISGCTEFEGFTDICVGNSRGSGLPLFLESEIGVEADGRLVGAVGARIRSCYPAGGSGDGRSHASLGLLGLRHSNSNLYWRQPGQRAESG